MAAEDFDKPNRDKTLTGQPAPTVDKTAVAEEYRSAYRTAKADDPESVAGFPDPDKPGQNFDAASVLAELRKRRGGLKAVPADELKGSASHGDVKATASPAPAKPKTPRVEA